MTPEQLEGKILTGLLHESDRQEYVAQYENLVSRARAKARDHRLTVDARESAATRPLRSAGRPALHRSAIS